MEKGGVTMIHSLKTETDFASLLEASKSKKVLLFKHSTTCSISAGAYREVKAFQKDHPDTELYINLVIEDRPLARKIASDIGVEHASPQAIVFKDGKPVWNASHGDVYEEHIAEAFQEAG